MLCKNSTSELCLQPSVRALLSWTEADSTSFLSLSVLDGQLHPSCYALGNAITVNILEVELATHLGQQGKNVISLFR